MATICGLAFILLVASCKQEFSIKGKLENLPEQQFRLEELGIDQNTAVDSGETNKDGSFELHNELKKKHCTEFVLKKINIFCWH